MKYPFLIMLFVFLLLMFVAQTMHTNNLEKNETFNIYNFTETQMKWNYTFAESQYVNETGFNYTSAADVLPQRISNLVSKTVDWIGYSLFEFAKFAIEFGYTHPQYDFGYFMHFIMYVMFILLAIAIFPIVIPLIALLYLAGKGIYSGVKWIFKKKQEIKK